MLTCRRVTIRSVTNGPCCRARGSGGSAPSSRSHFGGFLESTTESRPQTTRRSPWCRRYNFTTAANTSTGWWHKEVFPSEDRNNIYDTNTRIAIVPHRTRFASTVTTPPSSIESNTVRRREKAASTAISSSTKEDQNESAATQPPPHYDTNSAPFQSSSTTNINAPPDLHDDDDPHSSSSSSTFRTHLRARYQAKRTEYQCRADNYRDTARTHYQEFKDHPRQTARESAVSVKGMIQRYGPVFVGTYGTLYLSTLALLFGGVESGVLDPVLLFQWLGQEQTADSTVQLVVDFMDQYEFTKPYAHIVERNPSVANLAVAWIAVKFTEPIRLALAVAITPRLARYFGYTVAAPTTNDDNDDDDEAVVDPRTQAKTAASAADQSKRTNRKA